ncbi:MAG: type III secretion chaperone SycN [Desulfovibrio sp.]|nr:type III secretion chaperone SycN [Desulfovibrio sp.]
MFLQSAIEAFGQRLGMPNLAVNDKGLAAIDIAGAGRLHLEISRTDMHEELLVYLTAPVPTHDHDIARRALAFCHYRHAHALPLWAGLYKDNLMVLTRFSEREATGQALENAALFLTNSLNSILQGSN